MADEIGDAEAIDMMRGRYQRLCEIWDQARAAAHAAN
jgi:myo-inositol catabolism protein IolC